MNCLKNKKGYYPVGNEELASVTMILGIMDKPQLRPWSVKKALEYVQAHLSDYELDIDSLISNAKKHPINSMRKSADLGTAIHKVVEKICLQNIGKENVRWHDFVLPEIAKMRDELPDSFEKEITLNQIRSAAFAFADWSTEHNFTPLQNEVFVYSRKYKYAGRFDNYGIVDNDRTFIDWKSGNFLYQEVRLQLSAYKYAWCEMHKCKDDISNLIAVRLPKDLIKEPKAQVLTVTNYEEDFKAFLGAKLLFDWEKKYNKPVV
jgi:hypothetical protein